MPEELSLIPGKAERENKSTTSCLLPSTYTPWCIPHHLPPKNVKHINVSLKKTLTQIHSVTPGYWPSTDGSKILVTLKPSTDKLVYFVRICKFSFNLLITKRQNKTKKQSREWKGSWSEQNKIKWQDTHIRRASFTLHILEGKLAIYTGATRPLSSELFILTHQ